MRPASRSILIGAVAFLVFALAGFYFVLSRQSGDEGSAYDVRAAPEFALKDADGRDVRLADFRGRPLIIYVWASWCPRCPEGLQALVSLREEFGGAVAIAAINRAESPETARRFNAAGVHATGTALLRDPDDAYYRAIGGFAMPETLFVDSDGTIVFHKRGPMGMEEFRRRVEDLLQN